MIEIFSKSEEPEANEPKQEINESENNKDKQGQLENGRTMDGFLGQVDEQRKNWMNNIFEEDKNLGKDSKDLQKGFEDFLENTDPLLINMAKNELSKINNSEDVKKFIENHQGCKIGSEAATYEMNKMNSKKEKTSVVETAEEMKKERTQETGAEVQTTGAEILTKGEKVRTKRENKETGKKQLDQAREKTEIDENNAEIAENKAEIDKNNAEIAHKYRIAMEECNKLYNNYPGLKEKTDKGSDLYNAVEIELRNKGVIGQLEEIGKDIKDSSFVEDYIKIQATLTELKTNRNNYPNSDIPYFDKVVKDLQNSCNIPDTRLDSFSMENIRNTRRELFDADIGNQTLIEIRNNNKGNRDYGELFHAMSDENLISKYGKLLEGDLREFGIENDGAVKTFWDGYKNNRALRADLDAINSTPLGEREEKYKNNPTYIDYMKMIGALDTIKTSVEEKTKDLIEEMCLITQVNGMARCIGQKDFTFNKAREIKTDGDYMVIDGHIDGVDFSVRHNPKESRSPLQTSSKLVKTESANVENGETGEKLDKNPIEIGKKGKYKNSPFRLPGQESIFNMITNTIESSVSSTKEIETVDKYIEDMQSNITGKVDKVYEDANQAHDYMKEQVKCEKIVDNVMGFLGNYTTEGSKYSGEIQQSNSRVYDFVNMIKYNIDNSTETEKDKFLGIMEKINRMAALGKNNSNDGLLKDHPKIEECLTGKSLSNTRDVLKNGTVNKEFTENGEGNSPLAFDLFEDYKNKDDNNGLKLDFDRMWNDLTTVERDVAESVTSNEAEKKLEAAQNDPTIWPSDDLDAEESA